MLKTINFALAAMTLTTLGTVTAKAEIQEADIIVLNADIRTVDASQPRAEALAIRNGRFIAVGSIEYVKNLGGAKTTVIDAAGRTLVPGFADAHAHLLMGTDLIHGVDLYGMKDLAGWLTAIKKRADELPKGEWLVGGRWDGTLHMPTRQELDSVVSDRPVALLDIDTHTLWVNTKAIEITGITAKTKVPTGGEIVLDSSGKPTGILKETAMNLVLDHKAFTGTQPPKSKYYDKIVKHFNSLGVTTVHDMWFDTEQYEQILKNKNYTLRIWFGLMDNVDTKSANRQHFTNLAVKQKNINSQMAEREKREGEGPKFRFGYLKYFIDGTLASYTAALNNPYADRDDGFTSKPIKTQVQLDTIVSEANHAGFPVAIHAIGDKGVDMALNAFAQSPDRKGKYNRIEHVEIATPEAAARFGQEGVVASMQPDHAIDGDFQEKRLGKDRLPFAYAWQSILSGGALLVFGSDWPTAKESPTLQLGDAVLRLRNGERWYGDNALTFDEALYAYTQGPAIIAGWQDELGSITVGKRADFVILQGTVRDNPMTDIRNWQVDQTWFAGKKVYERKK